ncbi:hypothetical protein [Roseovarius rhodophyticola]|uniref:Uncharacterized protein n=1 Tax=Roseovarius rhodophyticola TaxID=3080827 RepID=A0ABZ2TH57_9RHOB|nr:hypothetical protein [Roseovarius sp. W115]MDV2929329.1 hypothetical protein [Roseovarius sp. W115]
MHGFKALLSAPALMIGIVFGFVVSIGLIANDHLSSDHVLKATFAFGVITMLAWRGVPMLLRKTGLANRVYKLPSVWAFRIWLSKPVWGYKRAQVLIYMAIWMGIGGHLLWFHEVFSPVPRVDRSEINADLRDAAKYFGTSAERLKRADRREPTLALVDLPYPKLFAEGLAPGQAPSFTHIPIPNTRRHFGDKQVRALVCQSTVVSQKPDCALSLRIPAFATFARLNAQQNRPAFRSSAFNVHLTGISIELEASGDQFATTLVTPNKSRRPLEDYFQVDLSTPSPAARMDLTRRGTLDTPQALTALRDLMAGRQNLWIEITLDQTAYDVQYNRLCADQGQDCQHAEFSELRPWTCKDGPNLAWQTCDSLQIFEITRSLDVQSRDLAATITVSNTLVPQLPGTVLFHRLNQTVDHVFLSMFAMSQGVNVELTKAELEMMKTIKSKIVSDYATVLGWDSAGDLSENRQFIERALIRQPQLYQFYRDREYWAPILKDALEMQLSSLGFR